MNLNSLALEFKLGERLEWACPNCRKVALGMVKDSPKYEMTPESKDQYQNSQNLLLAKYVYSCLLVCEKCQIVIANAGTGYVDVDDCVDDQGHDQTGPCVFFVPAFFHPPLQLIDLSACPPVIQEALTQSFKLFFASPNAAANQARVALELLLTELSVPRYVYDSKPGKPKKRQLLSLHSRIEQKLPAKFTVLKEFLLAGKWLSNEGSHPSAISQKDVLNLYELLEHSLLAIYNPPGNLLRKIAKKINVNKAV